MSVEMETCPASAPFFGFMGVTSALVFANIGAAYGELPDRALQRRMEDYIDALPSA